ncbi:MAG: class II D-tagatose-bisphosphate aldolase, non-catalytic subunit [Weeksellaceae bacterium]|nr:class II D-tagatose-bisphosphate aldolase, non-catalytic subunit [Weeksellaceae bacterium]
MSRHLIEVLNKQKNGLPVGLFSACTASSYAIKSTLMRAQKHGVPAVIEATANQVDQNGGYTGMKPAEFVTFVREIAAEIGFPLDQLVLGGDHLGPLTRTTLPEAEAMIFAEELVQEYVLAGFTKIHIDTSMRVASDSKDLPLANQTIAERGAKLCKIAEEAYQVRLKQYPDSQEPVYVIGSEVPIPGGAQEHEESISVTSPDNCQQTYETFKSVFISSGLESVLPRVVALVVQPGVEFGDEDVFQYNPDNAKELIQFGKKSLPFVYEGHSTDYQTKESLKAMVQDGIAFLKVGPALTYALREALFALEMIEKEIYFGKTYCASNFKEVLEMSMLNEPENWKKHYHGDAHQLKFARKYSFSDRARYYLPDPQVEKSIQQLIKNIDEAEIPVTLLRQYMPIEYESVCRGLLKTTAENLILEHIGILLDDYFHAIMP